MATGATPERIAQLLEPLKDYEIEFLCSELLRRGQNDGFVDRLRAHLNYVAALVRPSTPPREEKGK